MGANPSHPNAATTPAPSPVSTHARGRRALLFERDREIVHVIVRTVPVWHQRANAAAAVDQIDERGVRVRVRAAEPLFLGADAVVLATRGELRGGAAAADEA